MAGGITKVDFVEYFPIIKWVVGGLLVIISALAGYIWKKQQKQITELEMAVKQISADTIKHVTQEQFSKFSSEMDGRIDKMEQSFRQDLAHHNTEITGRLDDIMWHLINTQK